MLTVGWQGKPIWILRRTDEMLRLLETDDQRLRDPQSEEPQQPAYCKNPSRAIKPEYLVAVGLCTHLGCVPTFRPDIAPDDLGPEWRGGFYCPCHGSKFDLAGRGTRVFQRRPTWSSRVTPIRVTSRSSSAKTSDKGPDARTMQWLCDLSRTEHGGEKKRNQ